MVSSDSVLRPMTVNDIPQVIKIEQSCHQFPWTEGIFQDCIRVGYYCLVIEQQNIIEAYAVMSLHADECHILNICVKSNLQRHGYGIYLMRHLLSFAKQRAAVTAFLEVRRSNIAAIMLYDKLGFNQVGVRKDYYPAVAGREDAILLAMDLEYI